MLWNVKLHIAHETVITEELLCNLRANLLIHLTMNAFILKRVGYRKCRKDVCDISQRLTLKLCWKIILSVYSAECRKKSSKPWICRRAVQRNSSWTGRFIDWYLLFDNSISKSQPKLISYHIILLSCWLWLIVFGLYFHQKWNVLSLCVSFISPP